MESALQTLFQIHVEQPPGDVLVFLPGQHRSKLTPKRPTISVLDSDRMLQDLSAVTGGGISEEKSRVHRGVA